MTLLNKKEILVTSKSGEIYLIDLIKYKTKRFIQYLTQPPMVKEVYWT